MNTTESDSRNILVFYKNATLSFLDDVSNLLKL